MSLLNRVQSGLLFQSNFTGPQLDSRVWSLSPSDPSRISLVAYPGSATLYPDNVTGEAVMMLMSMPTIDQFVFEIKNSFFPSPAGDMAGIIGYISEENKMALMQYYDFKSGPVSYTNQRVQYKDGIFTGWGSSDDGKTWHLLGSDSDDYAMIGVALYAPVIPTSTPAATPTSTPYEVPNSTPQATPIASLTSPMIVDYINIFSNNGITVANLTYGQRIDMFSEEGELLTTETCSKVAQTSVLLNMTNMQSTTRGYLQLVASDGTVIETSNTMDLNPGDQFWFGVRMHVLMEDTEFSQADDNYIGLLSDGGLRKRCVVHNPDNIPYNNVIITVAAAEGALRGEYLRGWEWVGMSYDGETEVHTSLSIGTVYPGESKPFWLEIQRPTNPDHRFETNFSFKLKLSEGG